MQLRPWLGLVVVACTRPPSTPTLQPDLETTPPSVPAPTPTQPPPVVGNPRCPKTPRAIATEQDAPGLVVVDATNAYWTNQNGGQVMTAPLDGGAPRVLADKQHPFGIAIDATHVYWANNVSRTGSVMRVAKQGGAPEVVANTQGAPYGPALTGGALYWVNSEEGSVLRAALDGRDRKVLATKQAFPAAIVTDGRSVFWFHTKAGVELRKVSIDGGTPVTVATEHGNPQSLVIHGSRVYYTNPYRGAVMAVPLDGGAVEELVIDEHYPIELAVDDTSLYWIDHDRPSHDAPPPKRIRKAPLKGGDAITLASGKDAIGIAVDASCVYWTEARGTTGAVMAVAK